MELSRSVWRSEEYLSAHAIFNFLYALAHFKNGQYNQASSGACHPPSYLTTRAWAAAVARTLPYHAENTPGKFPASHVLLPFVVPGFCRGAACFLNNLWDPALLHLFQHWHFLHHSAQVKNHTVKQPFPNRLLSWQTGLSLKQR